MWPGTVRQTGQRPQNREITARAVSSGYGAVCALRETAIAANIAPQSVYSLGNWENLL